MLDPISNYTRDSLVWRLATSESIGYIMAIRMLQLNGNDANDVLLCTI